MTRQTSSCTTSSLHHSLRPNKTSSFLHRSLNFIGIFKLKLIWYIYSLSYSRAQLELRVNLAELFHFVVSSKNWMRHHEHLSLHVELFQ